MPTTREGDSAVKRFTDYTLGRKNGIGLIININGETLITTADLPEIKLDTDEAIGEMGFTIGQAMELISARVAENFNEIAKEKK